MKSFEEPETKLIPRSSRNLPFLSKQSQEFYPNLQAQEPPVPGFSSEVALLFENKSEIKSVKKLFPVRNNLTNSNVSIKKSINFISSSTANEYLIGFNNLTAAKGNFRFK